MHMECPILSLPFAASSDHLLSNHTVLVQNHNLRMLHVLNILLFLNFSNNYLFAVAV